MGAAGTAAAIGATASVAGAGISAMGAGAAGKAQAAAADKAAAAQKYMYDTTRSDLAPFRDLATPANAQAYGNFWQNTGNYLQPYIDRAQANIPMQMTEENLVKTPGYQFNLSQGLKAVQNAAAARGLGVSGTALKGAANFATGLADSTYQNQFNNAQTRFQDYSSLFSNALNLNNQQFNQLFSPMSLAENAAAQTGNTGATLAGQYSQAQQAAGQAQAAGIGTAAGALNQGLTGAGNSALTYALMRNQSQGGAPNAPSTGTMLPSTPYNVTSGSPDTPGIYGNTAPGYTP